MPTLREMNAYHLFTLGNVPVRLSLGYLLLGLYFSYGVFPLGIAFSAVSLLTLTLSLLVHEFGHALVARHYRLSPQIVLHGWGGFCVHERAASNRHDALIVAAGPAAGLALGVVAWTARALLPADALADRQLFRFALDTLVYINIYWSLVNLAPIWPLDGGLLFRLGALRYLPPVKAERLTHVVGLALAIVAAVVAYAALGSIFAVLLAAMIGFENAQRIHSPAASGPIRRRNTQGDELLHDASQALAAGDPQEALRLAHQARSLGGLEPGQLDAVWSLLAVASARVAAWQDVLDYSLRAPRIAPVHAARVEALAGLGRTADARRELDAPDAPALPPKGRADLEALLRG